MCSQTFQTSNKKRVKYKLTYENFFAKIEIHFSCKDTIKASFYIKSRLTWQRKSSASLSGMYTYYRQEPLTIFTTMVGKCNNHRTFYQSKLAFKFFVSLSICALCLWYRVDFGRREVGNTVVSLINFRSQDA